MKKFLTLLWIFFAILAACTKPDLNQVIFFTSTPPPTPSNTVTSLPPTPAWRTYTDPSWGLVFTIPADWSIQQDNREQLYLKLSNFVDFFISNQDPNRCNPQCPLIVFHDPQAHINSYQADETISLLPDENGGVGQWVRRFFVQEHDYYYTFSLYAPIEINGDTSFAQKWLTESPEAIVYRKIVHSLEIDDLGPENQSPVITPTTPTTTPLGAGFPYLQPGDYFVIDEISMQNETSGWALAYAVESGSHLLSSADGGTTWKDVTPPYTQIALPPTTTQPTTFFLDAEHAWMIFPSPDTYPAQPLQVWITADGGFSWQTSLPIIPSDQGEGFDPRILTFLDTNTGWLMVGHGAAAGSAPVSIYQTLDGGFSWNQVKPMFSDSDGTINVCCQSAMIFGSPQEGLVTSSAGPISNPRLNWTFDSGKTWTSMELPITSNQLYCSTSSPQVIPPQTYRVLVECLPADESDTIAYLYTTTNFGVGWTIQTLPLVPRQVNEWEGSSRSLNILFTNQENGWYLVQDTHYNVNGDPDQARSFIFQTEDGGDTWQELPALEWGATYSFYGDNLGWAAPQNSPISQLSRTNDGGQTWYPIPLVLIP